MTRGEVTMKPAEPKHVHAWVPAHWSRQFRCSGCGAVIVRGSDGKIEEFSAVGCNW